MYCNLEEIINNFEEIINDLYVFIIYVFTALGKISIVLKYRDYSPYINLLLTNSSILFLIANIVACTLSSTLIFLNTFVT